MSISKKLWYGFQSLLKKFGLSYFFYQLAMLVVPQSNFFCGLFDWLDKRSSMPAILASKQFFEDNADRVEQNLSLLADDESRRVYQNLVLYRGSRDRHYVKPIMSKCTTTYFAEDLIIPRNGECFFDCGGFAGENSIYFQNYLKKRGCEAPSIIAVEPDPENYKHLVKSLKKKIKNTVHTFPLGVWNEDAVLKFQDNLNASCKVDDAGSAKIKVTTIDHLSAQTGLAVTYIKMDIEGCELQALAGAAQTIKRFHPRLAIAIYHNDGQMLELIEYIHQNYPDYQLHVRHYSGTYMETVLYCL